MTVRRRLAAAAAAALLLAACSGEEAAAPPATGVPTTAGVPSTAAAPATSTTAPAPTTVAPATTVRSVTVPLGSDDDGPVVPFDESFYVPPDPLPEGRPGDVLRLEKAGATDGGTRYRLLYRSTSLTGAPVGVSGSLVVPDGPSPDGGWPVLSWAHGTTGSADVCAPSRGDGGQIPATGLLAEEGFVVVATDYEGLGTPGPHPYLVGASQGRGVLDAARAALRVLGERAGGGVVVWGHSQGGQSAVWAGEIASVYAPELALAGVVATAPVTEMSTRLEELRTNPFTAGLFFAAVAGAVAADPSLDPAELLTPEAFERLPLVEEGCILQVSAAVAGLVGRILVPEVPQAWLDAVASADAGGSASLAPILVFQGGADPLVPAEGTQRWVQRACAIGTTVDYRFDRRQDHGTVFTDTIEPAVEWMQARLAGEPAASTC